MIRDAQADDAQWIATLWNDVIANTHFTFTTELKSAADIADMIAAREVLLLPDEGGFATYGPFRAGPGYAATVEHTIILDQKSQGQGQGRALMQALCDRAGAKGYHVMVAGISSANPGAVAFHEALGFAETGHMPQVGHKDGHWLDLILMQKVLIAPDSEPRTG